MANFTPRLFLGSLIAAIACCLNLVGTISISCAQSIETEEIVKRFNKQINAPEALRGEIGKKGEKYWITYMTDFERLKNQKQYTIMHMVQNNAVGSVPTVGWHLAGIPMKRLPSFKTRQFDVLGEPKSGQSEIVYGDARTKDDKVKIYVEPYFIAAKPNSNKQACILQGECEESQISNAEKAEDIKKLTLNSAIYSVLEYENILDIRFTCSISEGKNGILYSYTLINKSEMRGGEMLYFKIPGFSPLKEFPSKIEFSSSWELSKLGYVAMRNKSTSYVAVRAFDDRRKYHLVQKKLLTHIYNTKGEEIDSGFMNFVFPKTMEK